MTDDNIKYQIRKYNQVLYSCVSKMGDDYVIDILKQKLKNMPSKCKIHKLVNKKSIVIYPIQELEKKDDIIKKEYIWEYSNKNHYCL